MLFELKRRGVSPKLTDLTCGIQHSCTKHIEREGSPPDTRCLQTLLGLAISTVQVSAKRIQSGRLNFLQIPSRVRWELLSTLGGS